MTVGMTEELSAGSDNIIKAAAAAIYFLCFFRKEIILKTFLFLSSLEALYSIARKGLLLCMSREISFHVYYKKEFISIQMLFSYYKEPS